MIKKVIAAFMTAFLLLGLVGCTYVSPGVSKGSGSDFQIILGPEMRNAVPLIESFAEKENIPVSFYSADAMNMMYELNRENVSYDAALISNSIWKYMLDSTYTVTDSKIVAINPVVFALSKSKADSLGFIGKDIYMQDIVEAVGQGKVQFLMASATQTNSGASTYLTFLNSLAGSPEILTLSDLESPTLKSDLKTLFSGIARTSGSEEYIEELFMTEEYDAMVGYESAIININQTLENSGKEPLYLIYPVDGVSVSDVTFGYISHDNEQKREWFLKLQKFLLSEEAQQAMSETGHRTGYGGLLDAKDTKVFRADWGIDTTSYLSPVKYPSSDVIKAAFKLFQEELKKPSVTMFCLDYSGSMSGTGEEQLEAAMKYILTPESASESFIQFGSKDVVVLIPFDMYTRQTLYGTGDDTEKLYAQLLKNQADGGTDVYRAGSKAISLFSNEAKDGFLKHKTGLDFNLDDYMLSIVLMTDGQSSGELWSFENIYERYGKDVGVYSIGFGDADFRQLTAIAERFDGKVFDGRTDLIRAFQTVRGYS